MSRSYHVTIKDFKGLTKKEIDEMAQDPNSKIQEWADKKNIKKTTIKDRKVSKKKKL